MVTYKTKTITVTRSIRMDDRGCTIWVNMILDRAMAKCHAHRTAITWLSYDTWCPAVSNSRGCTADWLANTNPTATARWPSHLITEPGGWERLYAWVQIVRAFHRWHASDSVIIPRGAYIRYDMEISNVQSKDDIYSKVSLYTR